jgi:hypothetical protein
VGLDGVCDASGGGVAGGQHDSTSAAVATRQVLHTLVVLGPLLVDFLYLVIPNIARMVERTDMSVLARRHAIDALGKLAKDVHVAGTMVMVS